MKTYYFTLILRGVPELSEEISERLFEAGCDDGSPYSNAGVTGVRLARDADTLENAIATAVAHVRKAGHETERVEIAHGDATRFEVAG